jgi:hypothetical protein
VIGWEIQGDQRRYKGMEFRFPKTSRGEFWKMTTEKVDVQLQQG